MSAWIFSWKKDLSEPEEGRLRGRIAKIEGTDSVGTLKEQFKKTDSLIDLVNLIEELEAREYWEDLCGV